MPRNTEAASSKVTPCFRRFERAFSGSQRKTGSTVSPLRRDRKSTRLNSSHLQISYAVFCLKNKTSLAPEQGPAQRLYEQLYSARGEMENRIKEQLSLFSVRLSTETMRANPLRLYFSSLAYVLVHALRRIGLRGTEWAEAQAETIRLKLLKIAARVRVTARRIWVCYSGAYPWKHLFTAAWSALRC